MPLGSITTGGKAQALVSPSGTRRGLSVQNNSTGDLRLLEGGVDASQVMGIRIAPSGYYETPPSRRGIGSWSIWGASDGQSFGWEEW